MPFPGLRQEDFGIRKFIRMFVYTFAKAARLGYINKKYHQLASKGFAGMKDDFLERDADGRFHLVGTVQVSGLGAKPYRDGSFEYYISEPFIQDNPKGMGAFILAANELQLIDLFKNKR